MNVQNKRLLLVEDDPKFRAAMVCALKSTDCVLAQAATLREAEVELQGGKFDLIIIDGDLPDGNGIGWLTKLRKSGNTTPAVFVSGIIRDGNSFLKLRQELNVSMILHKPVSLRVFKDEIETLLNQPISKLDVTAQQATCAELAEVASQYLAELPKRIANLTEMIRKATSQARDQAVLKQAIHESHMLRGTAGLFGFIEVGESMGLIEDTLQMMSTNPQAMSQVESWKTIAIALSVAREESFKASLGQAEQSIWQVCQPPNQSRPLNTDRLRVMLFDDDRVFARRVEAVLSADGILVYSFLDTSSIEKLLDDIRPELLLLDLNMPEISGLEICRQVRSSANWKYLPVVIVSGKDRLEDRSEAMGAGANGFLHKSLVNMALLNLIRTYIAPLPTSTMHRYGDEQPRSFNESSNSSSLRHRPFGVTHSGDGQNTSSGWT